MLCISIQHKPNIYIYIYIYYRSAILGIVFLGEFGFLILLDLGFWQFKPHTRPTSTNLMLLSQAPDLLWLSSQGTIVAPYATPGLRSCHIDALPSWSWSPALGICDCKKGKVEQHHPWERLKNQHRLPLFLLFYSGLVHSYYYSQSVSFS